MKILFLAAEVAPYASVGGLSQVMYFLPRSLIRRGHDARVFTARYGIMDQPAAGAAPWSFVQDEARLDVPVAHDNGTDEPNAERTATDTLRERAALEYGGAAATQNGTPAPEEGGKFLGEIPCTVSRIVPSKSDAPAYFLENPEYFGLRSGVFGYADDHTRFALLSKGCLEWLKRQRERLDAGEDDAWWPDVIHCHDWHTSYFIDLARRDERYRSLLADVSVVLTVHNFRYQGTADFRAQTESQRDDGHLPLAALTAKALQAQNPLRRGLLYADAITTVSPTHAVEVLTPEYAEGLNDTLQAVRGKLSGILNGVDVKEFDPSKDPHVKRRFTKRRFTAARALNKRHLQGLFNLPVDETRPLLGFVGRLTPQKGVDLLLEALPPLLSERPAVQVALLGSGEERFSNGLQQLQERFPEQVGLHLRADFRLPRNIFAGADVLLVPSAFEPGGIVALEALRYGALPLVRRTGGLNDSVKDFDPSTRAGNGFSFRRKDAWSLYGAIVEALTLYRQRPLWERAVGNALASDFSWDHAAEEYEAWYADAKTSRLRT